jgi:hypothetical protein
MDGDSIGSVSLGPSTKLIFTVGWWKGQRYAHVRKYIETDRYNGPTRSGLALGSAPLNQLILALKQLSVSPPGPGTKEIVRFRKRGDTEIVVTIVPPDDLASLPAVDVREYVDSPGYTGPTKKGVRFTWDKLAEVIGLLEIQSGALGKESEVAPRLFPESESNHNKSDDQPPVHADGVLGEILPNGPRDFPDDFIVGECKQHEMVLPSEQLTVQQRPDGSYALSSTLGFSVRVRNIVEGNFLLFAHLRGKRNVKIPENMPDVFRAVKAYENYVREIRHALALAYERKTGHKALAEHQARSILTKFGLPWL